VEETLVSRSLGPTNSSANKVKVGLKITVCDNGVSSGIMNAETSDLITR